MAADNGDPHESTSLISSSPGHSPVSPVLCWRQAADDVHSATVDGEYAGHVVDVGGGFAVHGPIGEGVGMATSLRGARDLLAAFLASATTGRSVTAEPSHRAGPRRRRGASRQDGAVRDRKRRPTAPRG